MPHQLTCVILAGGLGIRLRPVLPDLPKPMASVNGRPFLEYVIPDVRLAGFTHLILCVGYRPEVIEGYFADGRSHGVQIRYSRERELRGTAGALSQAGHLIGSDPFVVMNGDSLCAVDFDELLGQHRSRQAMATLVTTWLEDRARYGSITFAPDGTISRFGEKESATGPGYINGGIYVLNQSVLEQIPSWRCASLEKDIFPSLVGRGLYAFKTSGRFIDIGTPSGLLRAQALIPEVPGGLPPR